MARHRDRSTEVTRPHAFAIRTHRGPVDAVVCQLCGAIVLKASRRQHDRWHLTVAHRPDDEPGTVPTPTVPLPRVAASRRRPWR